MSLRQGSIRERKTPRQSTSFPMGFGVEEIMGGNVAKIMTFLKFLAGEWGSDATVVNVTDRAEQILAHE